MSNEIAKVKRYIERHGWTKGAWTRPDGRCCVDAAVNIVVDVGAWAVKKEILRRAVIINPPLCNEFIHYISIQSWNDHPGTSYQDVIKVLSNEEWE